MLNLAIAPTHFGFVGCSTDPISHILITRKFVSKEPQHVLAGIAPDTPFYLTYPAWVASQGKLQNSFATNDWPDPPRWMEEAHHAFHSLPVLALVAILARLVTGKWPRSFVLAWGLHILIDLPTHSRRRWGPKFLWPFSDFAVDGISWAELAIGLRSRRKKADIPLP